MLRPVGGRFWQQRIHGGETLPGREPAAAAPESVVVGVAEGQADPVGHRPTLRWQVVLASPGHGERLGSGELEEVASHGVMSQVEADAPGQAALALPVADLLPTGEPADQRGEDPTEGAEAGVDLANVVEERSRDHRSVGLRAEVVPDPAGHTDRVLAVRT